MTLLFHPSQNFPTYGQIDKPTPPLKWGQKNLANILHGSPSMFLNAEILTLVFKT